MKTTSADRAFREGAAFSGSGAFWVVVLAILGTALSLIFACATPFAAIATLAVGKLNRRDAFFCVGLVWLANQAVGYGVLSYPLTLGSFEWGVAIGASATLAALAAKTLSTHDATSPAIALPFIAAFATFEFVLYAACFMLPGGDGAFSAAMVEHILYVNVAALCGLWLTLQIVELVWRLVFDTSIPRGMPSSLS